ncbi:mannitol-1-phosphate 5-dehydrogenase [Halobacillus sp. B23F22_1]|uniref:mannitol-1-phosphate 5-dehydrogenase n=1 Tax=Halobacillus sp. B23F22_1 TaxID=3459514 RepID=UPI00373F7996
MRAIHFGAGNIGRGFIGMLLDQSGYETIFVDVNDEVIETLNRVKSYDVILAGADQVVNVKNVSGVNSKYEEDRIIKLITEVDLITTAVGANILPIVAPLISKGLQKRIETNKTPINIIACENMIGGSSLLKEHVYEHLRHEEQRECDRLVGFPNAAVDRIVPDQNHENPLTVEVEPFYEWVVETRDIKGEQPNVTGITYVEDLTPYIERKLFTVNTGHAAAAYLGSQHGLQTIKEVMDDESVVEKVRGTLSETGAVLIEKYQFKREAHEAYTNKIIERFMNPSISDEVTRVGRGPKRKLGPKDRLIRPAVEYVDLFQKEPVYLSEVIAAALKFNDPNDEESRELQQSIKDIGGTPTLLRVSELPETHPLIKLVEQHFNH